MPVKTPEREATGDRRSWKKAEAEAIASFCCCCVVMLVVDDGAVVGDDGVVVVDDS